MPKYSPDFFTSIDIKTAKITNSGTSGKLQMFNMGGIGRFFASPSSLNLDRMHWTCIIWVIYLHIRGGVGG